MSFDDKIWRLNNLYRIVDKNSQSIPFKLNAVQAEIANSPHKRKLILKARQLGMSTFSVIDILDDALFTSNLASGIVSYSLEHAQHIFKRMIGHALDTFLPELKPLIGIVSQSAREVTFKNGSFLRVDTSLRGGSYSSVLISEFGKTCARAPLKAEEVVTGTIQAVPQNGKLIIESTGEGNEGYFADMVYAANERGNKDLTPLDYQLFFYPWYSEPHYAMNQKVPYPVEMENYFDNIQEKACIILTPQQRYWYAQQAGLLGSKIKQEFPSTISEAFLSNSDAYYYAQCVEQAYKDNRVVRVPLYDPMFPVYIAMDIGATDLTVMIFFQLVHGEKRFIDYYSDTGKGVDFYAKFLLQDKPYRIHTIFLPHDAGYRDGIIVENTYEREFRKCFCGTSAKFVIIKRSDINLGISQAQLKFASSVFSETKMKPLLDHLLKYRKKWSEATGRYLDEPYHDIHSHASDSFRYACQAITHLEALTNSNEALEKHKKLVDNRRNIL